MDQLLLQVAIPAVTGKRTSNKPDCQTVRHSALCRNETSETHDITSHGHRHAQRERREAVSM